MPLVERRYAEALIGVAVQRDAIDSFQEELQARHGDRNKNQGSAGLLAEHVGHK